MAPGNVDVQSLLCSRFCRFWPVHAWHFCVYVFVHTISSDWHIYVQRKHTQDLKVESSAEAAWVLLTTSNSTLIELELLVDTVLFIMLCVLSRNGFDPSPVL